MVRRVNGRPTWVLVVMVLAAVALAVPAFAQNGMVKGTVRDEQGGGRRRCKGDHRAKRRHRPEVRDQV